MSARMHPLSRLVRAPIFAVTAMLCAAALQMPAQARAVSQHPPSLNAGISIEALAPSLAVGDLVFIRVPVRPFREVAAATGSWTNHVGIVVGTEGDGGGPVIAESTFPLSRRSSLARFVARSEGGRVAVRRLGVGLAADQASAVRVAARQREGTLYDTGFNLHSRRQFCSRYVREVLLQATGVVVGEVETFEQLLRRNPEANLGFWQAWYFGRIPWQRQTVTPASVMDSPVLVPVFDGAVGGPGSV